MSGKFHIYMGLSGYLPDTVYTSSSWEDTRKMVWEEIEEHLVHIHGIPERSVSTIIEEHKDEMDQYFRFLCPLERCLFSVEAIACGFEGCEVCVEDDER